MLICGGRIALDASTTRGQALSLHEGRVHFGDEVTSGGKVDARGYLALPGLINAHDHLELNLFPRLGNRIYANAGEWAEDIYHPDEEPVSSQLRVPKQTRLLWGGVKNLLAGATTVVHHNPPDAILSDALFPVRVWQKTGWAHSIRFSPDWQRRHRETPAHVPFVMHVAEGSDPCARNEIHVLADSGYLDQRFVMVHGVAAGTRELSMLEMAGSALVWCPSSNLFTLGQTLSDETIRSQIPLALGTDSAMTAEGDLFDELQVASRFAAAERLYSMVTTTTAQILKMPADYGTITDGGPADLLLIRDRGFSPAHTLLSSPPDAVFVGGRLKMASTEFADRCSNELTHKLKAIHVEGRGQYLCDAPLDSMFRETKELLGEDPKLAGKTITV